MQADEHRPFLRVEHISYREEEQVQEREQEVEDSHEFDLLLKTLELWVVLLQLLVRDALVVLYRPFFY